MLFGTLGSFITSNQVENNPFSQVNWCPMTYSHCWQLWQLFPLSTFSPQLLSTGLTRSDLWQKTSFLRNIGTLVMFFVGKIAVLWLKINTIMLVYNDGTVTYSTEWPQNRRVLCQLLVNVILWECNHSKKCWTRWLTNHTDGHSVFLQ